MVVPYHFSTSDYHLVIICSSEDEQKSHILSKLHVFRRTFAMQSVSKCAEYLSDHFKNGRQDEMSERHVYASFVDIDQ